ncbi:DUF5057 domain-containing protein [Clostridium vincentii]|uniref:VWFA domain-containing protein n=1 Tax=Clostridium vincentii TaxID=52704 RepID=A0A2T0BC37_9CLOT|nr:DUF5057 domain-containing protein [Clostridium vincentii]PRR81459.1 hypothetical protein CLVI_24860 [Clostridium vincentii]
MKFNWKWFNEKYNKHKKRNTIIFVFCFLILLQIVIGIPKVFAVVDGEPEIAVTLNTATPNPAKASDEITVNYKITPTKEFTRDTKTDNTDDKEVVFLLDKSRSMTQSDKIKNGLVNEMVNALIKDNNISKVNFTTISYNENVKVNEVDPNAKDNNGAAINYKEAVGNSVKNILGEANSTKDTRNLGDAINEAVKFFNKNDEKDSIKNIIIISEGEPSDQIPIIDTNQYNVITLALNKTSSYVNDYSKLKEWHKALGGSEENYFVSSAAESHNDINSNTSTSGSDNGEICKKIATRLDDINYKSYSLKGVKLNFDLGGNFEPANGLTYSTDNKDICAIDLPSIRYMPTSSTGGKSKYEYEGEDFEVSFKIKPKQGKAGELKFATNGDSLKNYISYYINLDNPVLNNPIETPTINVLKPNINILEIEPANSFKITNNVVNANTKITTGIESTVELSNAKVTIEHITMAEFIGKTDKLNGKYDVIVIGRFVDNTSLNDGNYNFNDYNKKDNDITDRKAIEIEDFIKSGQVVYTDSGIINCNVDTKLYKHYNATNGTSNQNTSNLINENPVTALSVDNIVTAYMNREDKYKGLTINSINPEGDTPYTEQNQNDVGSREKRKMIFEVSSPDALNEEVTVNLYLDINGDGLFKEEEIVKAVENINLDNGSISLKYDMYGEYPLFLGYLDWKLEVVRDNNIRSYTNGSVIFRKLLDENPIPINVLQIDTSNTTALSSNGKNAYLDLKNNTKFQNLVTDTNKKGYKMTITRKSITEINAITANSPDNGPSILNGQYTMIIIGFKDSFPAENFTENSLKEIEKFGKTGQGIMFTHDTIWYTGGIINTSTSSKYSIIRMFQDYIGQSRYNNAQNKNKDLQENVITHDNDKPTITDKYKEGATTWSIGNVNTSESKIVYNTNKALITNYPYDLGDTIEVRRTHGQYLQLNLEDENVVPWFNLTNNNGSTNTSSNINQYDVRNNYYTYSRGNITFSGTGENSRDASEYPDSEMKLFMNTIIKAERGANHAPTIITPDLDKNYGSTTKVPITQDFNFDTIVKDIDGDNVKITNITVNGVNLLGYVPDNIYHNSGFLTNITIKKDTLTEDTDMIIRIQAQDRKGAVSTKLYTIKPDKAAIPLILPDLF